MDYSKKIRELRKLLVLSQFELAELLGVSFSSVNRWENNKTEPTFKSKRKLNKLIEIHLQKNISEIKGGHDELN